MIKTKTINSHTPLVFTGYVLFVLLVISIILSTFIPFGGMLFTPRVLFWNVMLFTIFLVLGAILPVLIGYFIGDRSLKSTSKLKHHFNGVLFALLAYWMMTVVSMIMSIQSDLFMQLPNVGVIILNIVPSVVVVLITSILAFAHVRGQQSKQDILEYKPYSAMLILLVLTAPLIWSLPAIFLNQDYSLNSLILMAFTLLLGIVSYVSLWRTNMARYTKVVWSAVSVSVAYVAVFVFLQLVPSVSNYLVQTPTMAYQNIENIAGWTVALLGWITYWVFQVKSLITKR